MTLRIQWSKRLDLGLSFNLILDYVYAFGVRYRGTTTQSTKLCLANRFVKIVRGIMKDVLFQVHKFYYSIEFIVIDM